jgi:hypothetical protein
MNSLFVPFLAIPIPSGTISDSQQWRTEILKKKKQEKTPPS